MSEVVSGVWDQLFSVEASDFHASIAQNGTTLFVGWNCPAWYQQDSMEPKQSFAEKMAAGHPGRKRERYWLQMQFAAWHPSNTDFRNGASLDQAQASRLAAVACAGLKICLIVLAS